MNQNTEVLSLLKKRGNRGVTIEDFPRGFRLAARIYDLTLLDHNILTVTKTPVARYVLLR